MIDSKNDPRQTALNEVTAKLEALTIEIDTRQARVDAGNAEKNRLERDKSKNATASDALLVSRSRALIDGTDTTDIDKRIKALGRELQTLAADITDCQTIVSGNTSQIERLRRFKETAEKQAKKLTVLLKYQDEINATARDMAARLAAITLELAEVGLNASDLFPARFYIINTTVKDVLDYPENPLRFAILKS
jgi:mRNA degradation ribonuclease J1/J2